MTLDIDDILAEISENGLRRTAELISEDRLELSRLRDRVAQITAKGNYYRETVDHIRDTLSDGEKTYAERVGFALILCGHTE